MGAHRRARDPRSKARHPPEIQHVTDGFRPARRGPGHPTPPAPVPQRATHLQPPRHHEESASHALESDIPGRLTEVPGQG